MLPGLQSSHLEKDWALWLNTMFPAYVKSEFGEHHKRFWEWAWSIKPDQRPRPIVIAWSRKHGKSTSLELSTVALGARRIRSYVLYFSMTQEQADDHVSSIGALLESSAIDRYYPDMGTRRLGKYGATSAWRRNRFWTEGGLIVDAMGLDTAARGTKLLDKRPDYIVIDDVDGETDSALVIEKKTKMLTKKIIPAGGDNVAIAFGQNLITKNSIASRLVDGRADFLNDRLIIGPTPAVKHLAYEKVPREGKPDWYKITGGTATWPGLDLQKCELELNDVGLSAFLTEYQHDVDAKPRGTVFPMWDERYSVITWSEFARFYQKIAYDEKGRPRIPAHWLKGRALDRGATIGHPAGSIHLARPGEGDMYTDSIFAYREIVMPEWPVPETIDVSPALMGTKIVDSERPWRELVSLSLISHEAKDWVNALANDMPDGYKLRFTQWKPDARAGIGPLQNYMGLVDVNKPNPFRPQLLGRSRFILIVDDNQGALIQDEDGDFEVKPATDSRGFARLRAEIPEYQHPFNAAGEEGAAPRKIFDDMIDPLRALMHIMAPGQAPMSEAAKLDAMMPAKFRADALAALPDAERLAAEQCAYTARAAAKKQLEDSKKTARYEPLRQKYKSKFR